MRIEDLQQRHGMAGRLDFRAGPEGAVLLEVVARSGKALLSLKGAQVLSFVPAGHSDLMWLSPVTKLGGLAPIRGGIPVCWPWFANHPTQSATKPAHGFARTAIWQVVETSVIDATGDVRIVLAFETGQEHRQLWPFEARATLTATVGAALLLQLETLNIGRAAFDLTQALHTYFSVGEISRAAVQGLDGIDYLDKVDGFARKRQVGPVVIDGEVDRIYIGTAGNIALVDAALGRRILISKQGSASTVVWNPGGERAAKLGDLGVDGWRRYLCVETTNAGDDVVPLAPGARHVLGASYSVQRTAVQS